MARLSKVITAPKVVTNHVTLIGDIHPDQNWVIPEGNRIVGSAPRTDTGIVQIEIDGNPVVLSRSGLNLGIDKDLVEKIIDTLSDQGFTCNFDILETGGHDGTEPEHYSREDYFILQSKIVSSQYLTKLNPNLTKRYPQ